MRQTPIMLPRVFHLLNQGIKSGFLLLEVCAFTGMEMINDKAVVNQDNCLGCGRCESICPNKATSIIITDSTRVDDLINKLEDYVDVTSQTE